MKTNLKTALILAAIALPCTAFAAFAETAAPAFSGEIAFSLLAIVGLQLTTLADTGRRPAVKPVAAPAAPRTNRCYELKRSECPAA